MISVDDAIALIAQRIGPLDCEQVPLGAAYGRVLAEPLQARSNSPNCAVSAMDGYAVAEAAIAPGTVLDVIGESRAGCSFAGKIDGAQAVRIFTGAPLPDGADYVVMQEYSAREGNRVILAEGYGPSSHVRAVGSDFRAGDELVPKGTFLGPRAMVAAAAADVAQVAVSRRPQVALLATGDELAMPGTAHLVPDAIPESVSYGIAAMVAEEGGCVVSCRRGGDDLGALTKAAGEAIDMADLVIVTGGASVGERDFAKPMFAAHGLTLLFEKVAMKPGKPVWLGEAKGKLVLGLPGNPTSAMVTAALFLRPILGRLQGKGGTHRWRQMPVTTDLAGTGSRETFVRARWDATGLTPLGNQESGAQAALLHADWLIRRPAGAPALPAGAKVTALPF